MSLPACPSPRVPTQHPSIPIQLADRPTWRGLVVPAITLRHRNGTPVLGEVDSDTVADCLIGQRCQLCDQGLEEVAVLMARPQDFVRGYVDEPAQHPWCATYTIRACPMLSGRLQRHRTSPRSARPCGDPRCQCASWNTTTPDAVIRAGQDADPWFSVRFSATDYTLRPSARGAPKGVSLRHLTRSKIRLVTPGRPSADDLAIIARLGLPWS
ncbi:hypothetical protein [Planobispora rosea]|nr:hypothetical protein [Planobispora rosea]